MTGLYVMVAISIALALACVALCVQLLRKNKQKFDDAGILSVKEDNEKLKKRHRYSDENQQFHACGDAQCSNREHTSRGRAHG